MTETTGETEGSEVAEEATVTARGASTRTAASAEAGRRTRVEAPELTSVETTIRVSLRT